MQLAKRLDGIGEYYFSRKLREIDELNKQGRDVINLGIGSPDLPPHPDVIRVLLEESVKPGVHAYQPYKGSPVLRKAISAWYDRWYNVQLNPDFEILPLIGSKEGIMHLCMSYFEPGTGVLIPNPGYPTYASAVRLAGATPLPYDLLEENNYQPDVAQLERLVLESGLKVKGIFLNYPHMPTGQLPIQESLENLIAFCKKSEILAIHDNPYSFILTTQPMSMLSLPGAKECVVELNSLSKSHNMAGWRVGMLCGARDHIEDVLRFKSNMDSGMFLPVQLAAAKALSLEQEWYDQVNGVYHERRKGVFALLDSLDCDYSKEQAGLFVWARVSGNFADGYECSDRLLKTAAVFLTPGGIFGTAGDRYIRVSLCATVEKIDAAKQRIANHQPTSHG